MQSAGRQLRGTHQAADFILDHWARHYNGSMTERNLWDLALIGAIIYPDKSPQVPITDFETPNVWMYRDVDA